MLHSPGIKRGPGPSYLQEQQPPKTPDDAFNIRAVAAPLPDHLGGKEAGVGKVVEEQTEERMKVQMKLLEVAGFIPLHY